jgi:hypothetical protein
VIFTSPPTALVTTFGFPGVAANQSDRSTALLYTDEDPSLKYSVTSPTISREPGALFCVEKPKIATLVKLPGLASIKVPVWLTGICSRLKPPYGPSTKLKLLEPTLYGSVPDCGKPPAVADGRPAWKRASFEAPSRLMAVLLYGGAALLGTMPP